MTIVCACLVTWGLILWVAGVVHPSVWVFATVACGILFVKVCDYAGFWIWRIWNYLDPPT